ncbi:amidinotransferase [Candidatus Roizmanbacteria bacterium]|nr:amidinotransferase [Candidatus Roizmanbacteria bacterium]
MSSPQLTDTVVMISPDQFGFNPQTAESNNFQHKLDISAQEVQKRAMREFENMVALLRSKGITVLTLPSRKDAITPDAVYPNNWFSHHAGGILIVYPMLAHNRRLERQTQELKQLLTDNNISVSKLFDITSHEKEGHILEGTGSMVLDREHKVAFAMASVRTDKHEFGAWCRMMGYEGIFFHAIDSSKFPVYHTNIAMNMGKEFAVVCLESIPDATERKSVEQKLKFLKKEIVKISVAQIHQYCGNVLQLVSNEGKPMIVMSKTAHSAFTQENKNTLSKNGELIIADIPTIEQVGGGSARCMMAEVFK